MMNREYIIMSMNTVEAVVKGYSVHRDQLFFKEQRLGDRGYWCDWTGNQNEAQVFFSEVEAVDFLDKTWGKDRVSHIVIVSREKA